VGEVGLSDIKFEFAHKDHLPEIRAISELTYREHSERNPEDFAEELIVNPLEPLLGNSFGKNGTSKNIIVALSGETVVGHVICLVYDSPNEGLQVTEKIANIGDISFLPEYRGRGLGKQALQFLIPVLKDQGVTRIDAAIWTGNTNSEQLFKSAGFRNANKTVRLKLQDALPLPKDRFRKWRKWQPYLFWMGLILVWAIFQSQMKYFQIVR